MVAQLLSSTVAQIAALAAVIYIGATQSLIVAVVLAVAVVLSAPSREHLANAPSSASQKNTISQAKDAAKESSMKKEGKAATAPAKPAPSTTPPKPATGATAASSANRENFETPDELGNQMNMGSGDVAAAGQDIPALAPEKKGSESFSLMNAAPF